MFNKNSIYLIVTLTLAGCGSDSSSPPPTEPSPTEPPTEKECYEEIEYTNFSSETYLLTKNTCNKIELIGSTNNVINQVDYENIHGEYFPEKRLTGAPDIENITYTKGRANDLCQQKKYRYEWQDIHSDYVLVYQCYGMSNSSGVITKNANSGEFQLIESEINSLIEEAIYTMQAEVELYNDYIPLSQN